MTLKEFSPISTLCGRAQFGPKPMSLADFISNLASIYSLNNVYFTAVIYQKPSASSPNKMLQAIYHGDPQQIYLNLACQTIIDNAGNLLITSASALMAALDGNILLTLEVVNDETIVNHNVYGRILDIVADDGLPY